MNKPVILCVDDENIVLTSLKAQLKKNFGSTYTIELAENGEEALSIVEDLIEKGIDLPVVVADHIMPGIKGDELLARTSKISPKTMNIMLTGQADATAVGNAVNNARLYRYISKPWDIEDMNMTLTEAIRSFFLDKKIEEQNKKLEELVKQLKEYNEKLEEKVKERTEEIEKQKDELKQNLEKIEKLNEQLEEKNRDITDSLKYAKRIQDAILPHEAYIDVILPENFILFKPLDIVSGDFYWVKQVNHYIILAVADCTGHGVPGAFMSMLGISLLNEIVQRREITQANQVLNELRRQIKNSLQQYGKKEETKDGMDIALLALNTKTNVLQYSGAYNPLYLLRDKNGSVEFIEIQADRMPVGIHLGKEKSFTNQEIELEIGDTLYIFSDGYTDQIGGPEGKKFMIKNFKKLLSDIQDRSMIEQREILEDNLVKWMEDYEQVDDILVLGIRIN